MSNVTGEIDVDDMIEQLRNEKVPGTQAATGSATGVNDMVNNSLDNDENPPPQHQWDNDMPMGPGHHSADPFASREGKTLVWKDVNMTLTGTNGAPERKLLDDVWGEVPKRMTTAIMGPSGAGKTSLLNILAGRTSTHGRIKVASDIRLSNYVVDPTNIKVRQMIAFVAQDDSLQVTSTPREAIYFSAKLRLPRATTKHQLETLVERMLTELGLNDCADTIVGGALIKGISGGQRKRTSVGVELVTKPALVFLDEPTSGLDSFSAVQLCQVLKKVANAGSSVLFTIHQPSSEIFNSFDSLILLNHGKVMYQGPTENVPSYFGDRGHPNPPHYNPADWCMHVAQSISREKLEQDGFFAKDNRDIGEAFEGEKDGKDALGITITKHDSSLDVDEEQVGMATQTYMLFSRELKNLRRDTMALGARIGLTTFLSLLVGIIFLDVGEADPTDQNNLQSQFGALVMVMMMSMFGTAQPALLAFPSERPVFLREYSTNHYSVLPYFLSRLTMELVITGGQVFLQCLITFWMVSFNSNFGMFYAAVYTLAMSSTAMAVMLGCAVEDPKLGQELLPILFVPQMLFSGFFVIPELIPVWLRWAQYLCALTYSLRIMTVEEFGDREDCEPECDESTMQEAGGRDCVNTCDRFLETIKADPDETWWNWLVLLALFIFFRLIGLIILKRKALKFY